MLRLLAIVLTGLLLTTTAPLQAQEPGTDADDPSTEGFELEDTAPDAEPRQTAEELQLQRRITATFQAIDGLTEVTPDVRAGVVRLTGEVPERADKLLAADLAERFDGVLHVQNDLLTAAPDEEPPPPDPQLSVDETNEKRLSGIYSQIRSLENVTVEVTEGVVHLRGKAASGDARAQAAELARTMPGVLYVDNQITEAVDVADRVSPTWDRLATFFTDFVRRIPILGIALFIIFLFWQLSRLLVVWDWPFKKLTNNSLARGLLKQIVRIVVVVGGLLIALDLLDATTIVGALLGTAGVVGIALGFAFRDIAENYLASILLSLRRPFEANDLVELQGFTGRVVRLTMRETILMTTDGNHVRIANATVFKSNLINFSRNHRRRFDFTVGIGNEENIPTCLTLGLKTLKEMDGVLSDPGPTALIRELADSSVTLWFAAWVDQEEFSFGKVKSEAIRRIKESFDAADIDMPSPIYIVEMTEPLPRHTPKGRTAVAEASQQTSGPTATELLDLTDDHAIERQVDEERRSSSAEDLLTEP